jgi:tRNA(Ile)-lysidine synthase
VALSGGGDSVALLHLLREAGLDVTAVTVDHRLRPDSADEAARVAAWCRDWGVAHHVLVWTGSGDGSGNLMNRARLARRALLADWARAEGMPCIALGHTADDQAESLLMGLSRAAGIDGLCGLRPAWTEGGLDWVRPALRIPRDALRQVLRDRGLPWIEDPTNADDRFLRARVRKALATLAPLGLTPDRLAESAGHLAAARAALDRAVQEAAGRVVQERAGALRIDAAALAALPSEIARRLVQAAILWLTGADYPPRGADLMSFVRAMPSGHPATLAGCRWADGWLSQEPRAAGPARWTVTPAPGEVRLLGAAGLRQCPDWRATGLPRAVLEVTPGLWRGEVLLAAPCAGFGAATATCTPGFHAFLLSH